MDYNALVDSYLWSPQLYPSAVLLGLHKYDCSPMLSNWPLNSQMHYDSKGDSIYCLGNFWEVMDSNLLCFCIKFASSLQVLVHFLGYYTVPLKSKYMNLKLIGLSNSNNPTMSHDVFPVDQGATCKLHVVKIVDLHRLTYGSNSESYYTLFLVCCFVSLSFYHLFVQASSYCTASNSCLNYSCICSLISTFISPAPFLLS